jgi:chromate reductase, NAD(P)H dehydrogenase (quinone)
MTKKIIGFSGSLREASFNKTILAHMAEQDYKGLDIEVTSLHDIPLFNGDEEEGGDPAAVAAFKQKIKEAEGVLIVTPEYSHGTPGVLKNALDWAGSMTNENVLYRKPVLIAGASPTKMGTGFSQAQLRQTLAACEAYPLQQPQVFINTVHKKIENGKLTDEGTIRFLETTAEAFYEWIDQLQK